MMKKIFIPFIALLFTASFCKAQYVNIPDSNFRSFLISKYPSCFNSAKQMDTTCYDITNEGLITCSFKKISNLDGLQYFKSLLFLHCNFNLITSLPTLPNNLQILSCAANQLTSLPTLPNTLTNLSVTSNKLTSLPTLPDSLQYLYCGLNQLISLPLLPTKLRGLWCEKSLLTSLPTLPQSLTILRCFGNNYLRCLPKLPQSLTAVYCDSLNVISCVPNYPPNCNFYTKDSVKIYPAICNPINNVNQCKPFPRIQGKIFVDSNLNGLKDMSELYREHIKVKLSNGDYTFTNNNGQFEITTDSIGTYTLTIVAPPLYKAVPASITVNINSFNSITQLPNIALQSTVLNDSLSIVATPINWAARPGFRYPFLIQYENVGTTTVLNPTVNFNYDNNLLNYDSSSNTSVANSGSSLSLAVGNLQPGQTGSFIAYFKVKQSASLGTNVISVATINATNANASDSVVTVVRGSYDPNDKKATPYLTTQEVNEGKYIYYTIRFQNTGNDTAFTVVIADTLSNLLQAGEVTVVASSHVNSFNITSNIAYATFNEISLPDSNVNKPGSNGFIKFKVKPVAPLAAGTIIPNKAYIYFDYNKAIETNTATTLIVGVVPVKFTMYEASPTHPKEGLSNWTVLNKWITATEENTSHFNVQRSDDGRNYKTVGTVVAKGKGEYVFTDPLTVPHSPFTYYYRLEVVDKNGSKTYSEIKTIRLNQLTNQPINLFPNPTRNNLNITVNATNLNNTKAVLMNTQGVVIKTFNLKQGSQTIDIAALASGLYILQTAAGNQKVVVE